MFVDVFWSTAPGAGECVSEESWSQWCGVELILAALINWDSQCRSLTTTVDMRHFYRTITKYFDIYWYILCIKAVFIIYLTVVNLSKWSAFRQTARRDITFALESTVGLFQTCGWNTNIYKIQNHQQTWTLWRLWLQDIDLSLASNWLLLIFQIPSIMWLV